MPRLSQRRALGVVCLAVAVLIVAGGIAMARWENASRLAAFEGRVSEKCRGNADCRTDFILEAERTGAWPIEYAEPDLGFVVAGPFAAVGLALLLLPRRRHRRRR